MPRSLRAVALTVAILLVALWLAPVFLLPPLASRLAEAQGATLEFEGVRPALPWGAVAARMVAVRGPGKVEFTAVSARILPSGLRVEGSVGNGTLLLRGPGLSLRGAVVRAQSLPLEALDGALPASFTLRGTADGVYRFGETETLELALSRGAVLLRAPVAVELPFVQLVVAAGREDDGGWRIDAIDLLGPPLSGTARGRIARDGRLALQVAISRLDEPARTVFGIAGLPTGPLPYTAELGGTIEQPSFRPIFAVTP